MEQSEQYSRRDNLSIANITASYAETAGSGRHEVEYSSKTIEKDVLDTEVKDVDISTAHRITSKKQRNVHQFLCVSVVVLCDMIYFELDLN